MLLDSMLNWLGTEPVERGRLIMATIVEPIKLKTLKNKDEGRMSRGPDEGLILCNLVISSKQAMYPH